MSPETIWAILNVVFLAVAALVVVRVVAWACHTRKAALEAREIARQALAEARDG